MLVIWRELHLNGAFRDGLSQKIRSWSRKSSLSPKVTTHPAKSCWKKLWKDSFALHLNNIEIWLKSERWKDVVGCWRVILNRKFGCKKVFFRLLQQPKYNQVSTINLWGYIVFIRLLHHQIYNNSKNKMINRKVKILWYKSTQKS